MAPSLGMNMGFPGKPGERGILQEVRRACFLMNKREQINEETAAVTKEISLSDLPPCISTMWLVMDGGGCNEVLLAPYVAQVAKRVPSDHENRRDIKEGILGRY